eukprot:6491019-Amphidinium_carterae.7
MGESKGKEDRPPDSLRSWPGLDRTPPKWGGRATMQDTSVTHTSTRGTTQQATCKQPGQVT